MNSLELEKILDTIDLTKDAPSEEPHRQYYFMKKMRGILTDLEQKKGRKLTASAQTFGCQMPLATLIDENRINKGFQKKIGSFKLPILLF